MRIVKIDDITQDMVLAEKVYHEGRKLLEEGVSNLPLYKQRLKELGIKYIYVNDQISRDIKIDRLIKQETRHKSIKIVKKVFEDISFNKSLNMKEIKSSVNDIVDEILNRDNMMINMVDLKGFDEYTFEHSINVTVLAILMGNYLDYNRKKLVKIGTGSILHDIGKSMVPDDILNKKGRLTEEEYEIIKDHTRLGYDYIKEKHSSISPVSRIVILSHHERLDGSGYPRGLKSDEIHEFAKIAAIVDVFDALTSDRIYRDRYTIPQALDYITSNSYTFFDKRLVKIFLRYISVYPNGTQVVLNNGKKAVIKKQNENYPSRPVVITLEEEKEINLMKELNLVIKKID